MQDHTKRPNDAELLKIFEQKHANLACPICKFEDVMLIDRDASTESGSEEASLLEIYRFEEHRRPKQIAGVKTIAVACANCGFVRQFVLDVLLQKPSART